MITIERNGTISDGVADHIFMLQASGTAVPDDVAEKYFNDDYVPAPKSQKRAVRQNRWGNWRGYEGGKYVREFAQDTGPMLVGTTTVCGPPSGGSVEMPDAAKEWLNEI